MDRTLRVLNVEDSERDVALLKRHLERAGYELVSERVETPEAMRAALESKEWDVILCDYSMPHFNALAALALLQEIGLDIPFIIISGTVGEAVAVEAMRAGAHDYLMKDNLVRLVQAIERELHEAENRRARRRAEEELHRSEAQYRRLIETANEGVWILDQEMRTTYANQRLAEMLNLSAEEMIGRPASAFLDDDARADVELRWQRRARGVKEQYDLRLRRGDGSDLWVIASATPIFDEHGKFNGALSMLTDITERRRATEALRESEEHYRLLFESNPLPMWVYDRETLAFLSVNEAAVHHYGYSREEFLSMTIREIRPPEEVHLLRERVAGLKGEIANAGVWKHRKKDGSVIDVEITSQPISFAGRSAELVLANDVTERLRVEEALQETARSKAESLALLDTILASAPIGFAFHNRELVYERINESLAAINGLSIEQHLGRTLGEVLPEMAAGLEPILRRVLETGEPVIDLDWSGETSAEPGQQRYWLVSFYQVQTPSGEVLGVGVLVSEITERKKAEAVLRETEEKYRSIFENAVEGIFQSSLDGRFISVNPAMVRILGYESPAELMAHRTDIRTQHYVDAKRREELERMLAEQGVVVGFECEIFRKDLSKIWTVENIRIVRNESGAPLHYEGSIEDITERKTLAEQLRQSQKLEAIGMLAGGIAHDFNNLLTAITGYSDLTLWRLREEDPLHRNISEVKKAAERAATLTRQLLAFSRKQVLQPKALNLNGIVSELEKMLRRLIGEDVELRTVLAPKLGSVKADPGQIEQVLMNLAINARDAMPHGGKLTIETENVYLDEEYVARHIAVKSGPHVMLAVSDTGTGMDEQTRARIFEPFFTTKEVGKGTGLGLSTVYGIVKQSGGNIWVYSEVGVGTTFKIYLPRVDEMAQEYKQGVEVRESLQGTETILLAEDEEIVRELARQVLESYGYQVLEAANGGSALLICERHKETIHLLLTDVIMPEMSGRELAERLSQLRPEMRVLYMSGYTDNAIVHQGVLDEGANFIQKPFAPNALARKVRKILDGEGNG